jgi:hypothetical protein
MCFISIGIIYCVWFLNFMSLIYGEKIKIKSCYWTLCYIHWYMYLFSVLLIILFSHLGVPIDGKRLQIQAQKLFIGFSSEGSFTCHTCCNTGPLLLRSYQKDRWSILVNVRRLTKAQSFSILTHYVLCRWLFESSIYWGEF